MNDASWERKLLVDGIYEHEIELVLQNSSLVVSSEDDQSIVSVELVRNDEDTGRKVLNNCAIPQTSSSADTMMSTKYEDNKERILLYYTDNSKNGIISYDRTMSEEDKEEDEREPQENERSQTLHDHRQQYCSRSIDSFKSISITMNNLDAEETTYYEENERDAPASTSGMTSHPSMLVLAISSSSLVVPDEDSSYYSSTRRTSPKLVQSGTSREDYDAELSKHRVDSDSITAASPSLPASPLKQPPSPSQQRPEEIVTKTTDAGKPQVKNDLGEECRVDQEHESKGKNKHEETNHDYQSLFARFEELYLMGREKIRSDLKKHSTEKSQTKFSIITSTTSTTTTDAASSNDKHGKTTINVTLPSSARINQLYFFGKEKVRLDREQYMSERIPPKKFAFGIHRDNDVAGSTPTTAFGTTPPLKASAVLVLTLPLSARINELYLIGREKIRTDLKRFLQESYKLKGGDF